MKKIKYLNASGVPTPTPSGGGVNADLIAQGVQVLVGLVSSSISAKKNRELQEQLAKLSLKQQKELTERLQDVTSDVDRLRIMYKTFAVLENQKLIDSRKDKQLTLFYFLGGGSLLLVGMAIIFKRKK
jgi:predicted ABC-class ATPase|tara:strand:- start:6597 stop:6980 length:384 start_codon:yes stop_codon:yes gene_type:complete